jgi:hypothetical protein
MARMSTKRSAKYHLTVWLSSLLASLLLYVLAFPPLWFKFYELPYLMSHQQCPEWLMDYRNSYMWIGERTHLKKPMDVYWNWCSKKMIQAEGIKLTPQDSSP